MRKISSREELNRMLEEEKMGIRADLEHVNLSNLDLRNINLCNANLSFTCLEGTNLRGANLKHADLEHVNLSNADLTSANLENADLSNADLVRTDLMYANLRYANLRNADLEHADLRHTDLSNARLVGTNLQDIKINIHTTGYGLACPEKGSFVGYKKAGGCIVELLIPEDAKRSSATSTKCRCSKARVLDIEDIRTGEKVNKVNSDYDNNFIYRIGEIVYVDNFDENRWNECASGIHFFMSRDYALNY